VTGALSGRRRGGEILTRTRGEAALCQKPLAADYAFRGLPGVARALRRVRAGLIGRVVHVHGAFHHANGPDQAGRGNGAEAGGGAFLDLGVHLLDLTLALLGGAEIDGVAARCFRDGRPLEAPVTEVEDFATVRLDFGGGPRADLAASWRAHAGADCAFRLEAFGTRGGLELVNLGGGGRDFELAVREGRRRTVVARSGGSDLAASPVAWARRLARDPRFDTSAAASVAVAETVERVYGRPKGAAEAVPAAPARHLREASRVVAPRSPWVRYDGARSPCAPESQRFSR